MWCRSTSFLTSLAGCSLHCAPNNHQHHGELHRRYWCILKHGSKLLVIDIELLSVTVSPAVFCSWGFLFPDFCCLLRRRYFFSTHPSNFLLMLALAQIAPTLAGQVISTQTACFASLWCLELLQWFVLWGSVDSEIQLWYVKKLFFNQVLVFVHFIHKFTCFFIYITKLEYLCSFIKDAPLEEGLSARCRTGPFSNLPQTIQPL